MVLCVLLPWVYVDVFLPRVVPFVVPCMAVYILLPRVVMSPPPCVVVGFFLLHMVMGVLLVDLGVTTEPVLVIHLVIAEQVLCHRPLPCC